MLEKYWPPRARLGLQSSLIKNVAFETAIGKIQNDEGGISTAAERKVLQYLLLPAAETCSNMSGNDKLSFTAPFWKLRRFNSM